MSVRILEGDCRDVLLTLPDESIHCIVTSPPYFGLRDYGVDGQMGLEATPEGFIAGMVGVFSEVRRVLRDDGTLWLNIGDSYAGSRAGGQGETGAIAGRAIAKAREASAEMVIRGKRDAKRWGGGNNSHGGEIKPKDLIGIPWMLAFALRADGWYLRQDIIWSKPNPIPESVTDRCTKAHEYVFLLSKSARYYYDADAIREPLLESTEKRIAQNVARQAASNRVPGKTNGTMKAVTRGSGMRNNDAETFGTTRGTTNQCCANENGANKRSVWTIATQPFKEAHFATFPPALVEPCILAGCPPGGTVLDPFGGAGTTGLVADRLQRDAILIELNPEYAAIARKRITGDSPLFAEVA